MASSAPLGSLTAWSRAHIQAIFQAPSDAIMKLAIQETFSPNIDATVNGKKLKGLEDIEKMVLRLRQDAGEGGLTVKWLEAVEVPSSEGAGAGEGASSVQGFSTVNVMAGLGGHGHAHIPGVHVGLNGPAHPYLARRGIGIVREGIFGGVYVVSGLRRRASTSTLGSPPAHRPAGGFLSPHSRHPIHRMQNYERRKVVTARIESSSPDVGVDSRRIVHLTCVAADLNV